MYGRRPATFSSRVRSTACERQSHASSCDCKMAASQNRCLSPDLWKSFFDQDGRLLDEFNFRKTVFNCDVDPAVRMEVWKFLFGFYPAHSTERERHAMDLENQSRYSALKMRWATLDAVVAKEYVPSHELFYLEEEGGTDQNRLPSEVPSEDENLLKMLEITAKLHAAQQDVDLDSYKKGKRIVLKDVIRTDRFHPYFKKNENLLKVHHILLVYAMYHPDQPYLQGYNDILARFMIVLDSEVDCYWIFKAYIDKKSKDFSELGMLKKTDLVSSLMEVLDPELQKFVLESECGNFLFCHRWLLLGFKREFVVEDGLRIFEVLSSQFLELSSDEALKARHKATAVEMLSEEGAVHPEATEMNLDFSFDIFMAAAILVTHRNSIMKTEGAIGLLSFINSLTNNMKVPDVLEATQQLVYEYCKAVVKSSSTLAQVTTES